MSFLNDKQSHIARKLTWPVYGVTATHYDQVLWINDVRVILYPSGKIDILSVGPSDHASETEASIRERFSDSILGHVHTYYKCGEPDRLTPADRARGYQCDSCADLDEGGY